MSKFNSSLFNAIADAFRAFRSAHIDVLANEAKISRPSSPVLLASVSVWRDVRGAFHAEAHGFGRDKAVSTSCPIDGIAEFFKEILPRGWEACSYAAFLGKNGVFLAQYNRRLGQYEGDFYGLNQKHSGEFLAALSSAI